MLITRSSASCPLWLLTEESLPRWLAEQPGATAEWVRLHGFTAERHRVLSLPGEQGSIVGAVAGLGPLRSADEIKLWHIAGLADRLPARSWYLAEPLREPAATHLVLGWLMGAYRMSRYRSSSNTSHAARATLVAPANADVSYAQAAANACSMARDLINTPANDLGPGELAEAATDLARRWGAQSQVLVGDELRSHNYPLIHAVGAGSPRAPRLIDLRWGSGSRRVTLVGKGVCFDTGGLDLKPSAGMLLMKKDMAGAACVLAVAQLLMQLNVPVRLRVLIPAVENSVDGNAYRPGDVLASRKGLNVEIGNTDAEGRLVLADALCEADSEHPDLLIDVATLTGAARVALGPELPAVFSSDDRLLALLRQCGEEEADPLWPMPLWAGYDEELSSKLADLGNVSSNSFAGSIIGALFLKRFVTQSPRWLHLDIYGWNPKERPGRPIGAEPQGVRALHRLITQG
ncbi:MAG: leucyl aminopeptidase family protein [Sinobacteraceae bacterium]|nr:leucyl aminopeptidase family protein [Nevskiaceae bacterium]